MNKLFLIPVLFISLLFVSCSEDDLGPSIFDTTDKTEDPNSETYDFDQWLKETYLIPYNLDFRYRMQDVGSDMGYNLAPTTYDKAKDMAYLVNYLWFEVYGTIAGTSFLQQYGPRIIHLIGSPAYNPVSGTMVLGTAEGGIKVTLYRCNKLERTNVPLLNEYYFKTMHHEFAHILHQKKNYPVDFKEISKDFYDPVGWQYRTDSEAATIGCVSPYASSQAREDFVEVIAVYLVRTDAEWNALLELASKPGIDRYGEVLPDDGVDGKAVILKKLEMATKWLKESWGLDIQALHNEIMKRADDLNGPSPAPGQNLKDIREEMLHAPYQCSYCSGGIHSEGK